MDSVWPLQITANWHLACNLCSLCSASLSVSSKVPEMWNFSSAASALGTAYGLTGESRGFSFLRLQTAVSGGPGKTTAKKTNKNPLVYLEMALKERLLQAASHDSNLFSERTSTLDAFASLVMHKHTCTCFSHRYASSIQLPLRLRGELEAFNSFTL